jgi:malonyl-CoA O-methyltransferase
MQPERSANGPRGARVDTVALDRTVERLVRLGQVPWLHAEAAKRMAERLPMIRLQPRTVLDWSGPLGGSAALLQAAYPQARQLVLHPDGPSEREPAVRRSWWPWGRAAAAPVQRLRVQDVAAGQADLLWSNMALQGCADPVALFDQWHRAVAVGGFLMFSTLGPGSLEQLRVIYRQRNWGDAMLPFVDMHDLGDMLVQAGFADPVMDQEQITLTWPDAGALLMELRGLGANVAPGRHAGLRTPRWRDQLLAALQQQAREARPALTIELVYGHAFRVAARPRIEAQTNVSLDAMREMVRGARP